MFSLIGSLIRLSCLAIFILVLSHSIEWNGETISDQIKVQMSSVRRSSTYQDVRSKVTDWLQSQLGNLKSGTKELFEKERNSLPSEFSKEERKRLQKVLERIETS